MPKFKNLKVYKNAEEVPLSIDLYKQAADHGMTFWQFLELINPSEAGDTLTAFERQLKACGIIAKSCPEKGIYASTGEYFFQSDRPGSAILFPTLLQKTALWAKLNRVTDINKLVATTRTIAGTSAYQGLMIDDSAIKGTGRRFRVDQAGNFPRVKIGWSDKTNAVTKHGVQLDWTYEFVRRASIELLQTVVARIMLQDQQEVLNDAINIAINGDGGPNPAAAVKTFCASTATPGANEIKLEASTTAGAGELPYEGWLKFIGGMRPYTPNVVCGNLATLVKMVTMERPAMDPAEIITRLQETKTQGTATTKDVLFPNVELVLVDSTPDSVLLALDTAFALERVIELGSDLQEVDKFIKNQTEAMVLSVSDNVSKLFPDAIQVLDFSAAPRA